MLVNRGEFVKSLSEKDYNAGLIKFNVPHKDSLRSLNGEGVWGWCTAEDAEKYKDDRYHGKIKAVLLNCTLEYGNDLPWGTEVVLQCHGSGRPTLDYDWVKEYLLTEESAEKVTVKMMEPVFAAQMLRIYHDELEAILGGKAVATDKATLMTRMNALLFGTDAIENPLKHFLYQEVRYRLSDVLGLNVISFDDDLVEMCAEHLIINSDELFNYDRIDEMLRSVLKENTDVDIEEDL